MGETRNGKRSDRGAALLLALFLIMLLEILGLAYLRTVYADLRMTRERVRAARVLHAAEGAFEVLAARRNLAARVHAVPVGDATVRVTASRDGDGWRLETAGAEVNGERVTGSPGAPGVTGLLRPGPGGRWRLTVRFP
jgi:Tfp pilus assembly protein PilX